MDETNLTERTKDVSKEVSERKGLVIEMFPSKQTDSTFKKLRPFESIEFFLETVFPASTVSLTDERGVSLHAIP